MSKIEECMGGGEKEPAFDLEPYSARMQAVDAETKRLHEAAAAAPAPAAAAAGVPASAAGAPAPAAGALAVGEGSGQQQTLAQLAVPVDHSSAKPVALTAD
jgi:hypothetical protein